MKTKTLGIGLLGFLMLAAATSLPATSAVTWPNLPTTQVHLTVVDGTTSYFRSTLSGVPAGFDVRNTVYPGWCVDRSTVMVRGVSHNVKLYSSLNPPTVVSSINWRAINYILNHKQGSMMDVQEAIWHFTDAYSPISPAAQAMVAAANAHPTYDPATGAILAIICLPESHRDVQNSIIELRRLPGLSPGYWKHNVNVYNGGHGSYSGDPHITPAQLEAYAAYIAANFHPGFTLAEAQQLFQDNKQHAQWLTIANWFNAAAGRLPYAGD